LAHSYGMSKPRTLTAAHLRQLKTAARQIRRDGLDIAKDLRNLPGEDREGLFGSGLGWSWVYEFTMIQHVALMFATFGLIDKLKSIMEGSGDKAQTLLDFGNNFEIDEAAAKQIFGPDADETRKALAFSLFMSLLLQVECLENKGCYLSDLVEKVSAGKDKGDAAFFSALEIDRTIVSCPTVCLRNVYAFVFDFLQSFGSAEVVKGPSW
jgi:hypothetical protein